LLIKYRDALTGCVFKEFESGMFIIAILTNVISKHGLVIVTSLTATGLGLWSVSSKMTLWIRDVYLDLYKFKIIMAWTEKLHNNNGDL